MATRSQDGGANDLGVRGAGVGHLQALGGGGGGLGDDGLGPHQPGPSLRRIPEWTRDVLAPVSLQEVEVGGPAPLRPPGGISQWQVEAIMESLDSTVAQVVSSSGRSPWTDAAWRHIAMMHVPQRPCPDCGYSGPASQMLQFGVIWACETCQGVTW